MKLLVAALLLVACAAPQKASRSWPQSLRDDLHDRCMAKAGLPTFCDCLVRESERFSPDPEAPMTMDEARSVMRVCGPLLEENSI